VTFCFQLDITTWLKNPEMENEKNIQSGVQGYIFTLIESQEFQHAFIMTFWRFLIVKFLWKQSWTSHIILKYTYKTLTVKKKFLKSKETDQRLLTLLRATSE